MRKWLALSLVLAVTAIAATRISRIVVHLGGDWGLAATNPDLHGTATLTTGEATTFHLTDDGDANGQRITGVGQGASTGDALVMGQPAASADFVGFYPTLNLTKPMLKGSAIITAQTIGTGTCVETSVVVSGAAVGMVPAATAPPMFGTGAAISARVSGADTVRVRVCAIAAPIVLAFNVSVPIGVVP